MKFTENAMERITSESEKLISEINSLTAVEFDRLDKNTTMAVFVDIINGFINEGAMAAERIGDIIPENAKLMKKCLSANVLTAAFADCHPKDAAEFLSFPPHCISGTRESELVDELKDMGGYVLIPKNSTNGFHEEKFRELLECHPETDTFIVTGDCTDICVMQFCLSLKTYFTQKNKAVRIIVPVNCAETYDAPYHSSDFCNIAAYKLMKDSGIEFTAAII